ncbi:UNVERIFIED_ORG: transcriptional regulator, AraC family [Clostridioides difficile F501]
MQEAFSKAIEAILLVMSVVLVLSSCRDPNVVSLSSMHRRYLIEESKRRRMWISMF